MDPIDWDLITKKLESLNESLSGVELSEEDLDIFPSLYRLRENMPDITNLLSGISSPSRKRLSVVLLVMVFCTIESVLGYFMNNIIYWLIKSKHHDIWDDVKQKFISKYDDICYIPLSVKLKFLTKHDLGFFNDFAHKNLRNAFAHQNYSITEDGTILIYKKQKVVDRYELENLMQIFEDFQKLLFIGISKYASTLNMSFEEFLGEFKEISVEDFEEMFRKKLNEKDK